jgi:AAA+ superfamily predicted ATPase
VLLDEVETLAVDRSKLSLEANPIDVHRATDAVLASLDHLAEKHTNILFIATSNFESALDQAFISRADLVVHVGHPTREACEAILKDTLLELGKQWKKISALAEHRDIKRVAEALVGFDGRKIRKIVVSACALDVEIAIDPNKLTIDHLKQAIDSAKKERK